MVWRYFNAAMATTNNVALQEYLDNRRNLSPEARMEAFRKLAGSFDGLTPKRRLSEKSV